MVGGFSRDREAETTARREEKRSHPGSKQHRQYSVSVGPLAVPRDRLGRRRDRCTDRCRRCRPLLLQPRVVPRRRRDRWRRGVGERQRQLAESRNRQQRGANPFHRLLPGALPARLAGDRRHFKATRAQSPRICSGVSPGDPLPAASALLTSATMRRDNGASSPWRSAISVTTPCR